MPETFATPGRTATRPPGLVLTVVCLGTLLSAMGASTVTLALPSLGADLGASLEQASWVMESFLLTTTVLLLVAGRAGDLLGHGRVYLWGFVIFGVASAACGVADDLWFLVGMRVLQGVGGSMLMATGPALLTTSFPPEKRGRALGMLATATYTGLMIGPPLGGFLIGTLGWRSVFHLNVPIAAVIAAGSWRLLPRSAARSSRSVDWSGAGMLLLGFPLLLLAVAQGRHWGWGSVTTTVCGATGAVVLALFVLVETRREDPLLEVGLFRSRVFTGATLSAVLNYVGLFVSILLLPYYLEEARRMEPAAAGLLLAAQPLVMAVVASPSGWLSDRIGTRGLAVTGLLVLSAGLLLLSTVGPSTPLVTVIGAQAVMGLGTGVFISPNSSALMGAAPRGRQGTAGGVLAVARNFGMMVGVTAATTLFHAAGGRTGGAWRDADYDALRVALLVAAGLCALGALFAALRGEGTTRRDPAEGR